MSHIKSRSVIYIYVCIYIYIYRYIYIYLYNILILFTNMFTNPTNHYFAFGPGIDDLKLLETGPQCINAHNPAQFPPVSIE